MWSHEPRRCPHHSIAVPPSHLRPCTTLAQRPSELVRPHERVAPVLGVLFLSASCILPRRHRGGLSCSTLASRFPGVVAKTPTSTPVKRPLQFKRHRTPSSFASPAASSTHRAGVLGVHARRRSTSPVPTARLPITPRSAHSPNHRLLRPSTSSPPTHHLNDAHLPAPSGALRCATAAATGSGSGSGSGVGATTFAHPSTSAAAPTSPSRRCSRSRSRSRSPQPPPSLAALSATRRRSPRASHDVAAAAAASRSPVRRAVPAAASQESDPGWATVRCDVCLCFVCMCMC